MYNGFSAAPAVKNLPAWRTHGFDSWVREILWRRKWQPTSVFLPGRSHAQRSLVGYSPWSHKRIGYNLATKQKNMVIWCHRSLSFLFSSLVYLPVFILMPELLKNCHLIMIFCRTSPFYLVFSFNNNLYINRDSFPYKCCCSVAKLCLTLLNPWTAACQASLSLTISRSLPKFMSIESVMPSNTSSSVSLFFFYLQRFPASGSFPLIQLFTLGGQSVGTSASVLPKSIQGWFPLRLTGLISLISKALSVSSPAPQFKSINSASHSQRL